MDDKIPCPSPRPVGGLLLVPSSWVERLSVNLVWCGSGGPLPAPRTPGAQGALLDAPTPAWCGSHTPLHLHPTGVPHSAPAHGSDAKFPLCFWHLRISLLLLLFVWLWVGFWGLVGFFSVWSRNFKIYSSYQHFRVFEVGRGISMSAPSPFLTKTICHLTYGGFCGCSFKTLTLPCVIKSSLSVSVLEAVYSIIGIDHDSWSHFPNVEHLDHIQAFTQVKQRCSDIWHLDLFSLGHVPRSESPGSIGTDFCRESGAFRWTVAGVVVAQRSGATMPLRPCLFKRQY